MTNDFNPRPYVRGDQAQCDKCVFVLYFNPRPYVRGDKPLTFTG